MNTKQDKCIKISVIIFVSMCLFPPWYFRGIIGVKFYGLAGYGFLFLPPRFSTSVNFTRLVLQLLMVSVITAWMVYVRRDRKPEKAN